MLKLLKHMCPCTSSKHPPGHMPQEAGRPSQRAWKPAGPVEVQSSRGQVRRGQPALVAAVLMWSELCSSCWQVPPSHLELEEWLLLLWHGAGLLQRVLLLAHCPRERAPPQGGDPQDRGSRVQWPPGLLPPLGNAR